MSKGLLTILVAIAMLVVLPSDAQVAKQSFKKTATTVQTATVKPGVKGAHKKWTVQELQTAKQAGDKQTLMKQKDNRIRPQGYKSFAPRRVDISDAIPVTVPYEADFSTSGEAMDEDFIIINNNEDLSDGEPCTWTWSASNGAYYVYNVDGTTPADDYMVLPINLEGGKTYDVSVNAASWNYPEEFEVVAGTECTAAALTTEIIGKTIPENDAADFSGTFTPAADGVYYIAIHAISPADLYILSVYRFSIDVAPDAAAPEAVSDLTAAQVPHELKNVITFTAPTTTINGEDLTENLTIDILRNGEIVKSLEGVAIRWLPPMLPDRDARATLSRSGCPCLKTCLTLSISPTRKRLAVCWSSTTTRTERHGNTAPTMKRPNSGQTGATIAMTISSRRRCVRWLAKNMMLLSVSPAMPTIQKSSRW